MSADGRYEEDVEAVLLPDGWYEVTGGSLCFENDANPQTGETPGFYFTSEYGIAYSAPLSSLLAVRYQR